MLRLRLLAFLLLPCLWPCLACHSTDGGQSTQSGAESGTASNRAEPARLQADVAWLADDARAGRRAGTVEELLSARWIAARLGALGLEPAGQGGTFLQDFSVPLEPAPGKPAWIEANGTRVAQDPGALAPLYCAGSGEARGRAVWCGYGIELPERGWDDFVGRDLNGAIALLVRGSPANPPAQTPTPVEAAGAEPAEKDAAHPHGDVQLVAASDPFASAGLVFTKVMNAKRRGAVAVVLVQHPSDAGEPVLAFHLGGSANASLPCVSLSWRAAEQLFGDELKAWAQDLESASAPAEPAGPDLALACDVVRGHGTARNVLGVVPGVDRTRTVVLGAHFDHLGTGGTGSLAPAERTIHNGADDNASGTAAVLEAARLLKLGEPPPCDVLVALWSGEELGLLGSEHWAEHPTVPLERVVGNVNLDMVGRAGNGALQILGAGSAKEFAGWLTDAGPAADLKLTVSASSSAFAGSSDHATFAKRQKPVLHLFSGLHTDYHKPSDDVARFEADGAARAADLARALVVRMGAARELAFVAPTKTEGEPKPVQSGFSAWFGSIPNYVFEGPGVKIDGTSAGSPAEHAGFLAGDVLLALGDVQIGTIYDFTYALQHYKPGDVVLVRYLRDGVEQESRVTLSSRGLR